MKIHKSGNIIDSNYFEKDFSKKLIPLDEECGFKIRPGLFLRNGAVPVPGGVSFTLYSQNAASCSLVLFKPNGSESYAVIPFPESYRIGNVYSMIVFGLSVEDFDYAFSVDGPFDPEKGLIFDKTKYLLDLLIAEAWDAGGLYQVGSFPSWNRWAEWNGKYRDDLRRFLKGDGGLAHTVAERIAGSHDLYDPVHREKNVSVNFIICHDGFTLNDLYSDSDILETMYGYSDYGET